jgi:hypothetical protein
LEIRTKDLSAEDVLSVHPAVRLVVLSSVNGDVLFSQARQGPSVPPEEAVRTVMNYRAEYLTEISRRTDHVAGRVKRIVTCYENFDELIVISGERFLSITLEPDTDQRTIVDIASRAQKLFTHVFP